MGTGGLFYIIFLKLKTARRIQPFKIYPPLGHVTKARGAGVNIYIIT